MIEERNRTAAELYEVQPSYARFDQKNNMTRQRFWVPSAIELSKKRDESLKNFIENKRPGYMLEDWAFYLGSQANMVSSGFSINWPNRRCNSWYPLAKSSQTQTGMPVYRSYGKFGPDAITAGRLIRKMSHQFGADEVGFCLLDRRWVYSHWFDEESNEHYPIKFSDEEGYAAYDEPTQLENKTQVIPEKMKYVIVLIHEMDELGMATAPTMTQMATTLTTYSKISFITVSLAEFIRGLGYHAIPGANDTAISIPLAIDAGLGELGRNAKLITPQFGPRCRISKIITDLPLPISYAKPWGVTEFCNVCGKCAKNCPAGAIPTGERSFGPVGIFNSHGVRQWQVDHMKCFEYQSRVGTNCGICIRACPFNKSKHWGHDMVRQMIRRKNSNIDTLLVRADDLLGYGKSKTSATFWLK